MHASSHRRPYTSSSPHHASACAMQIMQYPPTRATSPPSLPSKADHLNEVTAFIALAWRSTGGPGQRREVLAEQRRGTSAEGDDTDRQCSVGRRFLQVHGERAPGLVERGISNLEVAP